MLLLLETLDSKAAALSRRLLLGDGLPLVFSSFWTSLQFLSFKAALSSCDSSLGSAVVAAAFLGVFGDKLSLRLLLRFSL